MRVGRSSRYCWLSCLLGEVVQLKSKAASNSDHPSAICNESAAVRSSYPLIVKYARFYLALNLARISYRSRKRLGGGWSLPWFLWKGVLFLDFNPYFLIKGCTSEIFSNPPFHPFIPTNWFIPGLCLLSMLMANQLKFYYLWRQRSSL